MKVFFKYGFSAYSGMVDQMVYQAWYNNRMCLSRRFSYPELTENNTHVGLIGKNLTDIFKHVSPTYMQDLQTYTKRNKSENKPRNVEKLHPMPGPLPLLVKMMFAWAASDPEHVDLATITIADIVALDANVRTICRAVQAGFLPHIKKYLDLTAGIQ